MQTLSSGKVATFDAFALPVPLRKGLDGMGFKGPTPIQLQAIPPALQGRDLLGCAQTDSSKTAAYGVPLVAKLLRVSHRMALILVADRKQALATLKVVEQSTSKTEGLNIAVLTEGSALKTQSLELARKPRIILATPGRLIEHLKRGALSLSSAELVVLDEADRMLELGLAADLNEILRFLPRNRQTLMFAATVSPETRKFAQRLLKDPVEIAPS